MASDNNGRRQIVVVEAPAHPVAQLQGPFEESMFESQSAAADETEVPLDAGTRRNMLLEAPTYQRVIAGRWKQKPGEKFHPLWKLVAQMSFGIHLLSEGMARSEEDVFQILQNHVDDIDIFLERTTEDFTLAQDDIQERLKCLKLPLQHPEVFERMLEDRTFRNSIVEGNEKIEHIVNRTGGAMKDALKDVQKGFDSSNALEKYLHGLDVTWVRQSQEHEAVFVAMQGNVEGWKKAFLDLHTQGNKLAGSLRKLTEVVNEMQQKAGEVSRRLVRQQHRQGGSIVNSNSFTYHSRQQSPQRSAPRPQQMGPPTKRPQGRHHGRGDSKEGPRADSGQAQRSGTGLSMRSTGDFRTETPSSRSASRTDTPSSGLDPTKLNIGSPRVIQVMNHQAQHRAESFSASVRGVGGSGTDSRNESALSNRSATPQHQLRQQESMISMAEQPTPRVIEPKQFAPVELPAEIPPEAFLQAPLSNRNRLSGLGFLPSERRAQAATTSTAFNPATALVELLRDPSRYSKLPLTPNSAATSPSLPAGALSKLEGKRHLTVDAQAVRREPTPEQTPPVGDENTSEGTPDTPAWASQVVDDTERQRVLAEKIPFSSQTPQIDDVSATPRPAGTHPQQSKVDTATDQTTATNGSHMVQPSAAIAPSELSAGYEDGLPRLTRQQAEAAMMINSPEVSAKTKKRMSFVAELEGSEPIFLPATVYTPVSALAKVPEAQELEGSDSYFSLPIQSNSGDPISAVISELSSDRNSQVLKVDDKTLANATSDQIQIVLEEAVRKSVSDVEIPALEPPPVPSVTEISELPTQMTPKPPQHSVPPVVSAAGTTSKLDSDDSSTNQPATAPAVSSTQNSKVSDSQPVTSVPPVASSSSLASSAIVKPAASSSDTDLEDDAKSRPITTILSPLGAEQLKAQVPRTPGYVTAQSSPMVPTDVEKTETETARPTSTFRRSVSETKVKLGKARLSVFPPLKPVNTAPTKDAAPASPASAPDIVSRPSPKSSESAPSPASLTSVHSAPASDLTRPTTKETRKQWTAFFSGQLKSPRGSPSASIRSIKSPSILSASSHKHTNSQTSQTNASVKTLWLNSPTLGESPTKEKVTVLEAKTFEPGSQSSMRTEESRPSVVDNRQASSPTLGFAQPTIGLGLLTSPTVASPTSAVETPVIATATTSTAFNRQAPRSVSASSSTATTPAITSAVVSHPKPRMIEVRRKAVGSGIGTGSGSRPPSAAGNEQQRDSITDEKSLLSVSVDSRSSSPLQRATSTQSTEDSNATPKIPASTDTKPKLSVETVNKPRQINIVNLDNPSVTVNGEATEDKSGSPKLPTSPGTVGKLAVPLTGSRPGSRLESISESTEDPSNLPTTSKPTAETGYEVITIANTDIPSTYEAADSAEFIKGHERDSSDDSYDFLNAYT